jgi:hypothetical protein
MGFVLQFGNGPNIYITGDKDHHERLLFGDEAPAGDRYHLHRRRLQQSLRLGNGTVGFRGKAEGGDSLPLRHVPRQLQRIAVSHGADSSSALYRVPELAHGSPFAYSGSWLRARPAR